MSILDKKRIMIIVQARMGASRLPGKPLKEVMGRSLLSYQLERLRRTKLAEKIVIATTTDPLDDPIENLCQKEGIACFRGNALDVLDRYYQAAKFYDADIVVRITGDCPLIDPEIIDQVISYYCDHSPQYDYVSNSLERTYPRGLDTEVFSFQLLEQAAAKASSLVEREHVTPYFYQHPERFSLGSVRQEIDQSFHRWTVDTPEDLELVSRIFVALYPENPTFTTQDVLKAFETHPDWLKINAHIVQKPL